MLSNSATQLAGTPLFPNKPVSIRRKSTRSTRSTVVKAGDDGDAKSDQGWFNIFAPKTATGTQILKVPEVGGLPGLFGGKTTSGSKRTDQGTVLVAGATGRLGARIVRELLARGFRVRAGVRNPDKAELLEEIAPSYGELTREEQSRLTVVYLDIEDPDTIGPALGRSAPRCVVCAVGAAESEFTDLSAPKRIDYEGSAELVRQCADAGVEQFVLVTSLGTGKLGFPAGLLNAFGGVLTWKRKTEEELERSGMVYTIVRPGGMERPKDDYKLKNNVRIAKRDTLFGGQVSRLQVAELIGAAVQNPELAENKVLEVVAEPKAPFVSYEGLLSNAVCEITQEEKLAKLEMEQEVESALEEAQEELEAASERLSSIRRTMAELSRELNDAKKSAKDIEKQEAAVLRSASQAEAEVEALRERAQRAALEAAADRAVVAESQRAQREARLLTRDEIKAIRQSVLNPPKEEEKVVAARTGGTQRRGATTTGTQKTTTTAPAAAAPLLGVFGTLIKKAPVVEEEEEEEEEIVEEPVKTPAAPFNLFGGFGSGSKKQPPAAVVEEEEEEVVEEVVEVKKAAPKSAGGFAGLFNIDNFVKPPVSLVAEEVVEEQVVVVEEKKPAPPPPPPAAEKKKKPAAGGFGGFGAFFEDLAKKQEEAAAAQAAAKKQADLAAIEAVQREREESIAIAQAAENARKEAAAKARAEKAAAAEAAKAKEEAEAKKAAESEKAEAKKAAADAQAKKDEEAKKAAAAAAAAAAATAAAQNPVPPPPPQQQQQPAFGNMFGGFKLPWQQDDTEQPPQQSQLPPSQQKEVPANVTEAREWISNWRAGKKSAPAPAPPTSPPQQQQQTIPSTSSAADNAASAKQWIENWKSKQSNSGGASESSDSEVPFNVAEAREWIKRWKSKN